MCCGPVTRTTRSIAEALAYLRSRALPQHAITRLAEHPCKQFADEGAWCDHLHRLGIDTLRHSHDAVRLASEGGLWWSIKAHGFLPDTVILSDVLRQAQDEGRSVRGRPARAVLGACGAARARA